MENEMLERYPIDSTDLNLSDFALFLSVMKNREAYECTLSIILDEEDLKLTDVKVEEVILNESGKRAIRLDAWAMDEKDRQFNSEMQNDTDGDDVRKRARFYQSMIDSPILKSGKNTKYRDLSSTVIIFITQEDIFKKDLALYTFTEQCEEIPGLQLGDGTKKLFLNMSSRNGRPELISLLQYMKQTRIDNPAITEHDRRIERLDEIVREVKRSEEWEAVSMSIYKTAWEQGIEAGRKAGMEQGIEAGRKAGMEAGMEAGIEAGIEEGAEIARIELLCRKLRRGKAPEVIAEEMEEELSWVLALCEMAESCAPEYDDKTVYKIWKEQK